MNLYQVAVILYALFMAGVFGVTVYFLVLIIKALKKYINSKNVDLERDKKDNEKEGLK